MTSLFNRCILARNFARPPTLFQLLFAFQFMSCSAEDDPGPSGTGGSTAVTGGSFGSGGTAPSGGQSSSGGEVSSGGGSGGAPADGGSTTGGSQSGGSASGGSSSGGAGSGGETMGTGGSESSDAVPSAGCGSSATGDADLNDAIVTFPGTYDGSTPMPLVFAFHGAGRTNQDFRTVDARTQGHSLEDDYIIVYLKSDGNDWLASSNRQKFDSALTSMLNDNCVDESRVFATGHSSGAQFITTLLCGGEDRFLGVAPVAGGVIGQCNDHPAIHELYIHGQMDSQRGNGNGAQAADLVLSANSCGDSIDYEQPGCNSSQNQASVDPGCREYEDCSHRMIWCSHNDPNYSGTNHGWPCFANDAIKTFFDSL